MITTLIVIGLLVLAVYGVVYDPLAVLSQCDNDPEFDKWYKETHRG